MKSEKNWIELKSPNNKRGRKLNEIIIKTKALSDTTKNKENHNGTLGQLKAIRENMKKQLEEYFQELSTNPTPKRRQKLDLKVAMMRETLTDNYKMIENERSKHDKK